MSDSRVTMGDVARQAGVSIATVSRVLNGNALSRISPATQAAVAAAAASLNYHIDPIGRALRRQSTASLGLVVPNITNPFFPALIQAVEAVLRKASWSLLLTDAQDDPAVEREVAELLVGRRIDALLISPCDRIRSRPTVNRIAQQLPVVQIDRCCTRAVDHVGVDQADAIDQVLDHLAGTGRTRLAFVGTTSSEWAAHQRELAFRRWARRNRPAAAVAIGESTVAWGKQAVDIVLATDPDVDGIVCSNDLVALGVLAGLEARRIPVPRRISVTGFDNTLFSTVSRPELTTVAQPMDRIAEEAVGIALAGQSRPVPARIQIRAELVVRGSSMVAGKRPAKDLEPTLPRW